MNSQHQNYVNRALKTAADLDSPAADLTHAILGLCDESAELLAAAPGSKNECEELGDLLWFSALGGSIIQREAGIDVWESVGDVPGIYADRYSVMHCACMAAGLIKKPFAYGSTKLIPFAEIAKHITYIIRAVQHMAHSNGWSLEHIQEANIAKLQERFKGGSFTAENAINRDVDAELNAIKG